MAVGNCPCLSVKYWEYTTSVPLTFYGTPILNSKWWLFCSCSPVPTLRTLNLTVLSIVLITVLCRRVG